MEKFVDSLLVDQTVDCISALTGVADMEREIEVSIIMPCLNEAETLAFCINRTRNSLRQNNIEGEIIIADNGSTDDSVLIAKSAGARVVNVLKKGYGSAIRGGIEAARGKYIIMGDADASYDFFEVPTLLTKLREGYDLVMGNRFEGGIQPKAMPFLHRYLGNPVLSFFGRLFYNIPIGDFHCGLRGFNRMAYHTWDLKTGGMEFASEMVVKAALNKAKIAEVPVTLSPDGRSRPPHLRTWQDGWRHLHFLLINSPRWLFFIPGLLLFIVGMLLFLIVLPQPVRVGHIGFDVHTLLIGMTMVIAGFQAMTIGVVSRIYSVILGTKRTTPWINRIIQNKTINLLIFSGVAMVLIGVVGFIYSFTIWGESAFSTLNPRDMIRLIVPFMMLFLLGFQVILFGFLTSIIRLKIE